MAYRNLTHCGTGAALFVQEKAKAAEYIVLQHEFRTVGGVPQTLVVRRYLAETTRFAGLGGTGSYRGSDLDGKCQAFPGAFLKADIAAFIPSIEAPVNEGGASAAISRRCFSLSATELGLSGGGLTNSGEGAALPYFNSNSARVAQGAADIAFGNYVPQSWWTRTVKGSPLWWNTVRVEHAGTGVEAAQTDAADRWYRPAFCLPGNLIGNWAAVRVTLNRGTATAACWIAQISGMAGLSQTFILSEDNRQLRADLDAESEARESADSALAAQIEANRLAAFTFKGSVDTFAGLPADSELNDVWETLDTGDEYYWGGAAWKPFGPTIAADTAPAEGSANLITSGGVYVLLERVAALEGILADAANAMRGGAING